jgi:hypothetical protein
MPLFSHKDEGQDDVAAMDAEIERAGALTLPQLGAEVMSRGFGADGPGGPGKPGSLETPGDLRIGLTDIARQFTPAYVGRGVGRAQTQRFDQLVAEGLQVLENAALVRVSWSGGMANYVATRLGRAAEQRGAVQRILEGGSI